MPRLFQAFAETDTLSYGPFSITKIPGEAWKEATFTVDGVEIKNLAGSQKLVAALLISGKGQMVRYSDYAIERGLTDTFNHPQSAMKVFIHHLKKGIRNIPDIAETADCIQSVNPSRLLGLPGAPNKDAVAGYRLVVAPSA